MESNQQKLLASKLKKRIYKNTILDEGEFFDKIYFVIEGKIECKQNDEIKHVYSANEHFGEVGLFIDFMTNWKYEAIGEVVLYELDNYQVPENLGKEYLNIIMESVFKSTIVKCQNLKEHLTEEGILALYNIFKLELYLKDKIVYRKDALLNKKLSIIVTGKLVNEKDPSFIVAKEEDIYGEEIIDSKEK